MSDSKRKIRFKVESLAAPFDLKLNGEFQEIYHGVVINESYSGACLVTRNDGALCQGHSIRVKVGGMNPTLAKVIWIEELDADVIKFGIEYQK